MSLVTRDGFLYRRIITGILAAGTGVAIYYGYYKWKSRPSYDQCKDGTSGSPCTSESKTPETQKTGDSATEKAPNVDLTPEAKPVLLNADSIKDFLPDPTPVLQPEPFARSDSCSTNGTESLSVSGTFEKLSLPTTPAVDLEHSPTDGFERVSLTGPDVQNLDAPTVITRESGGDIHELVLPAGGRHIKDNGRIALSDETVRDEIGLEEKSRTEMRVELPGAIKPEPVTAKSSISVANVPKSVSLSTKPIATSAETKQPTATSAETKQPTAKSTERKQPTATSAETKQPTATSAERKLPMSKYASTRQSTATSTGTKLPTATSTGTKLPTTSSVATKLPIATSTGTRKTSTTSTGENQPTAPSTGPDKSHSDDDDVEDDDDDDDDSDDDDDDSDASADSQTINGYHSAQEGVARYVGGDAETVTISGTQHIPTDIVPRPEAEPAHTSCPEVIPAHAPSPKAEPSHGSYPEVKPTHAPSLKAEPTHVSGSDALGQADTRTMQTLTKVDISRDEIHTDAQISNIQSHAEVKPSRQDSHSEATDDDSNKVTSGQPSALHTYEPDHTSYTQYVSAVNTILSTPGGGQTRSAPDVTTTRSASEVTATVSASEVKNGNVTGLPSKRRSSSSVLKETENVSSTLQRIQRSRRTNQRPDGRVLIGHPGQPGKYLDLGMVLGQDTRHIVDSVDSEGLARDCSIRAGEEILTVNNMAVSRWTTDVLLQLFARISGTEFELTLSSEDDMSKGLIRHITVNLKFDKHSVKVKPIIVQKTSTNQVAPPVELGTFTPKACLIQKPETGLYLTTRVSSICMGDKTGSDGSCEMMRLLFSLAQSGGYHVPVTMLAFSEDDVISYICAVDRHTLTLMHQKDLCSSVDYLKAADCRFFNHRFVAGFDCFEATQLPDHYLSYDGRQVVLTHISSTKLIGQEKSIHFKVHYNKPGK